LLLVIRVRIRVRVKVRQAFLNNVRAVGGTTDAMPA